MYPKHKNIPLSTIVAFILLSACRGGQKETVRLPAEGFDTAYFDVEDLRAVANDTKAVWFHFYDALGPDQSRGTVFAMGAFEDHRELYSVWGPWYRRYKALSGNGADCTKVLEGDALEQIRNLVAAGGEPYAAMFRIADVWALIDQIHEASGKGIRLTPRRTDDGLNWTMELEAVIISQGTATVVPVGSLVCTTPCPEYCGNPATNFLNRRI